MTRRLLLLGTTLAALLVTAPAQAQLPVPIPVTPCGGGTPTLEYVSSSNHFYVTGTAAPSDVDKAAIDAVYDRLVTQFGWAAPPDDGTDSTNHKYFVEFATQSGTAAVHTESNVGNNPHTSWADGDATTSCVRVDPSASTDAIKIAFTREFAKAILHGIGALESANPSDIPEPWIAEGAPTFLEDEAFPDLDGPNSTLPPAWSDPLGQYSGSPPARAWFILRGLTERLGTGVANGAEQPVQDFFEYTSGRSPVATNLSALEQAFTNAGVPLAQAFHDYAIAAFFLKPCTGGYAHPYCFVDAAAYPGATGRTPQGSAGIGAPYDGSVNDDLALTWVSLPTTPFDLTLKNTDSGGTLQGTVACDTGAGLRLKPLPAQLGAGQSGFVRGVDVTNCSSPTLVVTSASHNGSNPSAVTPRAFTVTPSEPTGTVTVARFGSGLVTSSPAGINCGDTCTGVFPLGTTVTLTATPAAGQELKAWGGACSGTGACKVTATADGVVVGAGFGAKPVVTPTPTPVGAPGGGGGSNVGLLTDTTGPKLVVSKPKLNKKLTKLSVELTCPVAEPNHCTGPVGVTLLVGKRKLRYTGEAIANLAGGDSDTLTWKISKSQRKRLKRVKKVKATVGTLAHDDLFNSAFTTRSFSVRVPKQKR